jgi:hypothetical protein
MMVLCTDIWVHTYVGGCIRLSPLHVARSRMDGVDKKPCFQVFYECYINSWLLTGNILGILELKVVVGHICLNESLVRTFT